ncbi:MAG: putative zinc-binding protein [Bellilinea sp.]
MSESIEDKTSSEGENRNEFETIRIKKTRSSCSLCEDYAKKHAVKPIAILSCEGACLRGEISRQAANRICFRLAPEKAVRICLGGAFTKDTGQRALVRNASRVVAIEGCPIRCASRMMQGVLSDLQPEVIVADALYDLDGEYFGIDEVPENQIRELAETVATKVLIKLT